MIEDNSCIKLTPQIVGNIGLYYCCYHLSKYGWNVMPTARNARGIDIVAYSQHKQNSHFVGIQVKALSKKNPVPLGTSTDRVMGDYWVIVNNISCGSPNAFILLPDEVRDLAKRMHKDGKPSCWLQPKEYCDDKFLNNWERIVVNDSPRN